MSTGRALGQASSDQDLMSLSLEDLANTKVYTASRHLEQARQAPSAVTVITSDEIARFGWRTLGDVQNGVRGFYTAYDRDYTYLGVRGIQRPGDYNARILLMINGHRVNDNIYDSAAFGTEFTFSLDLIDRIEIVRGPSSSLFGSNAVFGVINIITRRPPETDGAVIEVSGSEGSFLSRRGRVTGMLRRGELSAVVSGSMMRSDGVSDLYFPEFADVNGGIAHDLDGFQTLAAFSDLEYRGFRVQGFFGRRSKDIPTGSYGSNFDSPEFGIDSRGYAETSYHRDFSAATDLNIRTYYDWYNFSGAGSYGSAPNNFVGQSLARAAWVGGEAVVGHQIGRQRITVGGDYEFSPERWQENYAAGFLTPLNANHSTRQASGFAEVELHFLPKLTIRAGGRLDWFDEIAKPLSPRVAAIYQANSRTTLKYIFGRAFRAPNAYEQFYTDGISIAPPIKNLKPEYMISHEVVFERTLRPWLTLTADGFYNSLTNLIDEVPDPNTNLNHFVNIGHDQGRGFELEAAAKRESGVAGNISYTFANATDKAQNSDLANSPSNMVKARGTVPVSRNVLAGLEVLYTGSQTSYQGTMVPSSSLTNLTLSTKPMWGGWEFSASCYDVFNQRSFAPAGPELLQPEIRQDGRTFRFKINYRLPVKEKRSKR
ncbi:MAG TPA: TonB-dependent receptor [Terriglobales bacterium]|nr:TonB-dependent receptor [Terriglobales bacterium]